MAEWLASLDWPSVIFLSFGVGFALGIVNHVLRSSVK